MGQVLSEDPRRALPREKHHPGNKNKDSVTVAAEGGGSTGYKGRNWECPMLLLTLAVSVWNLAPGSEPHYQEQISCPWEGGSYHKVRNSESSGSMWFTMINVSVHA